jgi:hypothetical protein
MTLQLAATGHPWPGVCAPARREADIRAPLAPEAVIAAANFALGLCAAWLVWSARISPF